MNVLFISSGNNTIDSINPIVKAQGDSLEKIGITISYYPIIGKGLYGYLKNVFRLRKYLRENSFDIIHAHYLLTAIVASLAGAKPVIVSMMGSEIHARNFTVLIIKVFKKVFQWRIILKSQEMFEKLKLDTDVRVIPNGVNMNLFKPMDREKCCEKISWDEGKRHILFAANPCRFEKNFNLAKEAFQLLQPENKELHTLNNVPYQLMPYYFNAADVVLLTSLWEGSPNVVKEAMACNRPVISTEVGDVRKLFGQMDGYFISKFDSKDLAEKLSILIENSDHMQITAARERISELMLDSNSTANKIIEFYR